MITYTQFMEGVGFDGRSVRNVDPIQATIRDVVTGKIDIAKSIAGLKDNIQARIIRDIKDIVKGTLPVWMPQGFKIQKKIKTELIKQIEALGL